MLHVVDTLNYNDLFDMLTLLVNIYILLRGTVNKNIKLHEKLQTKWCMFNMLFITVKPWCNCFVYKYKCVEWWW